MIGGVQSKLRQLDIYRKLPSDLTEPTKAGAIISFISILIIVFLFITELREFDEKTIISEMFVDSNKGGEQIRINLDIEFTLLPCDLLSLDVQDAMGTHFMNVEGKLIKKRILNGKVISEEVHTNHQDHDHKPPFDFQRVSQAFSNNEGCQIIGYIEVNKVPGNFHISSHAFGQLLHQILHQNNLYTINLSHKINHLSFGEYDELGQIKQNFDMDLKGLNPLDGIIQNNTQQGNMANVYQYFVYIVPTTFTDIHNKEIDVYQFVSNHHTFLTEHLPAVYFRFELQPVTVKYTQQKESFIHFSVEICGIIGGVLTIARLLDSFVHKSVVSVLRKFEMNKFY